MRAKDKNFRSFRRRWLCLTNREDGGVTVEFVLWIPVFITILALVVDASMLMLKQANFWEVARDTARVVARHGMTETAAETYAANKVLGSANGSVTADVTITSDTVTVSVGAPGSSLTVLGAFNWAFSSDVTATVTQAIEPK